MELIITEKPSSMRKIAAAIADGKPESHKKYGVQYFTLTRNGNDITVVSAVGHLYTVAEKNKGGGWKYPVFDIEWIPSADASKGAAYTRKYLKTIKSLAKKADTVTIATDFDIEGEVIGYSILNYACNKQDGNRMKYSTVTVDELKESYDNKMTSIAWPQAMAGKTRHELDWYYGINLSRALTLSVKAAGGFKILSSGRVQTPALKLLADKEKEIKAFKPDPYWQLELTTPELTAMHEQDRFWKQEEAQQAQKNTTKKASVKEISTREYTQKSPNPFDLTSLQTEAYRSFGMSPKETLSRAQDLYSAGYISYPRTSSQQLPKSVGYKKILSALQKISPYKQLADKLLKKKTLKPNNGKKSDPAHPAIYPTGNQPKTKQERTKKVYDLIVRRFLATFAEDAKRETMKITLKSGEETYNTSGTRTTYAGWHEYYGEHTKQKEEELPALKEGDELTIKKLELLEKETQPPRRYTPSSIIKELEKRGLGTKATRADIVENLFDRGYVHEKSIQVNEIGLRTITTIEKYVPEIVDEKLTKSIEEEMEQIRQGEAKPEEVLQTAKKHLEEVLKKFKKHEQDIGKELLAAERETQDSRSLVGRKPDGEGFLLIKKSRYGQFIGSSNYPEDKTTFSLPKGAYNEPAHKKCPWCKYPLVHTKRKRRGKQLHCFNPECESKELTPEGQKRADEIDNNEIPSPDGEGNLVVRRGSYGTFVGSSAYPKSRYTENLETIWDSEKDKRDQGEDIDSQELLEAKEQADKKKEAAEAANKKD